MTIKPCSVALLGLLLCACGSNGTNHESEHERNPQQRSYVCNTPADAEAVADVTMESRASSVRPDGTNQMEVLTFDGSVPGPVLRMKVGQTLRVKLVNRLDTPIGLHFLGLSYPVEDDGTSLYPHSVVNPGCAHVYTVTAKAAGVFPFVDHLRPSTTLPLGLYGAVIVAASDEQPVDREFVIFLGELGIESTMGHGHENEDTESKEGHRFYMTFNGRSHASPLTIVRTTSNFTRTESWPQSKVGERIRMQLVNVSPNAIHSFGLHGYNFCDRGGVIDDSGVCPRGGLPRNIVNLTPLEGTTVEVRTDNPGRWMYHCHILDHVEDGMMGYFDVTR